MRRLLTLFLLPLLAASAHADVGQDLVVSGRQQDRLDRREGGDSGNSFAPVVGFEPTYRFVAGAAWFYEQPRFSVGVDVNTNFRRVYQVHANMRHAFAARWEYGLKLGVTRGFDPYYGEGGATKPTDYEKLWGTISVNRAYVAYKASPIFSFGLFADARIRTEEGGGEGSPVGGRRHPDETTYGFGIFQKVDTRESKREPREGFVFGTTITHVPGALSSRSALASFTQLEADFIVYKEVLDTVIPDVIAAFQLSAGTTFGTPSYAYGYRLGGADKLRGYTDNRFRGKNYYMQQTELRFPIWKPVGGTAFIGFGDATDGTFSGPKMAYGVGLTIGLPPDWVSKIRVDLGFGKDQSGVFADFGYVF